MTLQTADLVDRLDEMGKADHEFKEQNNKRLEDLEKTKLTQEQIELVDKINADFMSIRSELDAEIDLRKDAEKIANRPNALGQEKTPRELEIVASTAELIGRFRTERGKEAGFPGIDTITEEDYAEVSDYRKLLNQYLRIGKDSVASDVMNQLQVGIDPRGGYWVDPEISTKITEFIYESSPIRSVANVETISTDALEGSYDLDEASLGGWVNEVSTRTGDQDTPDIGEWRIPVEEQFSEPHTTQKVLDDARIDVAAWLTRKVSEKFSRVENTAFVTGDGAGKPRGFTTYTAGTPTAATFDVIEQIASGSASTFTTDGIVELLYALKKAWRINAQWMLANDSLRVIRQLKDGDGNYIWQPDFTIERQERLLGKTIVEAEDMPAIAANAEPLAIANWAEAYTIVDRGGVTVLRDPFTTKGKVKFYMTKRVGGDVINFDAIKLQTIST